MNELNKYINAVMAFIDKIFEAINNISFLNINPKKKTLAVAFTAAVVVIAMVSGVFIIGEVLSDEPTTVPDDTLTTQAAVSLPTNQQDLKGNFLVALTFEDNIKLLGVIRLDSAEKSMKVSFLTGNTYCSFNNLEGTMNDHYKNGGVTELMWAVGEYANISIEKYIVADESSFGALLEHIGEMTVDLDHKVVYKQDAASFTIEKGYQTLIPSMMSKYFYYICDNQSKNLDEVVDVMTLYTKALFISEDPDQTKNHFDYMIRCLETNISALDFNNYKAPIMSLSDPAVLDNITIEEDMSTFR